MPETIVVNIRQHPGYHRDPSYVYIGRHTDPATGYFGNPYQQEGVTREEALTWYSQYLLSRLERDVEFHSRVLGLYGKKLVCFCHPERCHGDLLAAMAERLHAEEEEKQRVWREMPDMPKWKQAQLEKQVRNAQRKQAISGLAQEGHRVLGVVYDMAKQSHRSQWRENYLQPLIRMNDELEP